MEKKNLICIGCPLGCRLTAVQGAEGFDISGYTCKRGLEYAQKELTCPQRTVTSTVRVIGGAACVVSVRTASDVPKAAMGDVMRVIHSLAVDAPVSIGDVLAEDIAGTGVSLTATKAVAKKQ